MDTTLECHLNHLAFLGASTFGRCHLPYFRLQGGNTESQLRLQEVLLLHELEMLMEHAAPDALVHPCLTTNPSVLYILFDHQYINAVHSNLTIRTLPQHEGVSKGVGPDAENAAPDALVLLYLTPRIN